MWTLFGGLSGTALGGALALLAWAANTEPSAQAGLLMMASGSVWCAASGLATGIGCHHTTLWLVAIALVVGSPVIVAMGVMCAWLAVALLGLVLHPPFKLCCELCCPALLGKLEGDSV